MATTLQNNQMLRGSVLMLFIDTKSIGFATSHTLSVQTSTSQVSTKDHGLTPATVAQEQTWSITAENIYSTEGKNTFMDLLKTGREVDVIFGKANMGYDATGTPGAQGPQGAQSIVGMTGNTTGSWNIYQTIASGKAILTDFSINAPNGDYATISATLTGSGKLTIA